MARIQLDNTEFEGANAVYLLGHDSDGPTTLIDTGIPSPPVETDLRDALAGLDVAVADLDQILLTHRHADHAALAGTLAAESGAPVRAHQADAPYITREPRVVDHYRERLRERVAEWGMPAAKRTALERFFDANDHWSSPPAEVDHLAAGETVRAGEETLEVVHLPGHTAGQIGFLVDRDGESVLYSGDALLPTYTPNVGGADILVEDPLPTYLDSLRWIVEADPDLALPGHRQPIHDPAGRASEIMGHHRERTVRVVEVLSAIGPADAWTVSAELFGELDGVHILHGPGEASAHLEHLLDAGVVTVTDGGYALADEDVDPAGLIPVARAD